MNYKEIFIRRNLNTGRLITMSKSGYRDRHPENLVIFNANVLTENAGKIWYGDLDITRDVDLLKDIALEIEEPLYILSEMDCRFETESIPVENLIKKAKVVINP